MKIRAVLYQDDIHESIADLELDVIPTSLSIITINVNSVPRRFKILHSLFLDFNSTKESYRVLQRVEEDPNQNRNYFLLYGYPVVAEPQDKKVVRLSRENHTALICGTPLEYEDSIQVDKLCYRVRELEVVSKEFDSDTVETIIDTWDNGVVTVDQFKRRPPDGL